MGHHTRVALIHVSDHRPAAPAYQRLADSLNRRALRTLRAHGYDPTVHAAGDASIATSLTAARDADLIVLMGGEDIHPSFYAGAHDYPRSGVHNIHADDAQISLVRDAVDRGTPLLGICRGHQIINVALGGDLVQHLPQDGAHRLDLPHGSKKYSFTPHRVQLHDSDWADAIDAADPVQSSHHQAVGRLGTGLAAVATAHDGVVEAIAHIDAPVLGVQWHPEHPAAPARQLTQLVDGLADRAGRNSIHPHLRNPRVAA
ncbi:hypothetical protein GCM10009847_17430 [Leucobacter tardus]|uniref:Gamma-glutamyl-gamma-aminobutyrate hydrolase family protein n=1 Tax=Leucobacter tardus TaxID=501483 RepID=A0A939QF83_9MICO|nr:gamma-glutamyl-gamma-aminobutyrate hydrolase family protein [Leucobacter tardus]MBO2990742.1 gamma-glutamyl-gamma-aminobutyrate hydrolase family protein [Leucobacter tardus]